MPRKTIGYVLIALGVIAAVVSLAADAIGIGTESGINGMQLLGTAIGVVVALAGAWLAFSKASLKK